MALPFPTTYYLAIGTAISNAGVPTELSGGSYARLACGFTGTAMAGLTQTVGPWVVATAPTPAVNSYYGLLYDALTGGNLIAYWTWNSPYTGSLTAFPSTVINISFSNNYAIAMNMAVTGGQGTTGSLIDSGAQIGTVNGNPMLAGNRLSIAPGGVLAAHIAGGQWVGALDVQNQLSFAQAATTNINNAVTALAGGSSTASTPVMTGFFNRLTTVTTSLDSVILPALSIAPVGSMVAIVNSGAQTASVWPDTGSSVNAIAANTIMPLIALKSAIFCRISPTLWVTIPYAPT